MALTQASPHVLVRSIVTNTSRMGQKTHQVPSSVIICGWKIPYERWENHRNIWEHMRKYGKMENMWKYGKIIGAYINGTKYGKPSYTWRFLAGNILKINYKGWIVKQAKFDYQRVSDWFNSYDTLWKWNMVCCKIICVCSSMILQFRCPFIEDFPPLCLITRR